MASLLTRTPGAAAAVESSARRGPVFVPHSQVGDRPNIIVDGAPLASTVLTLSHWPNNQTPDAFKRDTSTATVFAYLDSPESRVSVPLVSNNHFDEDGLFSMFALCDPDVALDHRQLLIDAALIGDFGIVRSREAAQLFFTVEAFADPGVSPLPASTFEGCERQRVARLYTAMLERLPELLDTPARYRSLWLEHESHFEESERLVATGQVTIEERPDVDMAIVQVPAGLPEFSFRRYLGQERAPVHPFAINSVTERNRVVTVYGRRLTLEYRYESWVQLVSRRPMLRADLGGLAGRLNAMETAPGTWRNDPVTEVVPRLHLEGVCESEIDPARFIDLAVDYLASAPAAWDPYDWHEERGD